MFAATAFYLLIIFCDVAPLPALRIFVVILAQVFTGGEIYRYFKQSDQLSLIEYAAFGFSFGALTWLVSDQLFISLAMPKVGWILPLLLVVIWRLINRDKGSTDLLVEWGALRWISIATLLGLSGEWVWTLPVALFLCGLNFLYGLKIGKISKVMKNALICGAAAIAGLLTLLSRPKVWWISQGDTHFYEGLTKSVAKWGWQESIFSAGFSLQYHWFPYAWSGLVTRISGSPDWVVLTRVGVLVPALCLISFVWLVSTRLSASNKAPVVGVILFCASSVFGEWFAVIPLGMFGSFSQLFATLWLMPVLLWSIDATRGSIRKSWIYLSLLFIGLVGGKVSHAAIAAAFVLSFQFARVVADRKLLRSVSFECLSILLTLFVVSRILFGAGGSLSPRPAAWAPYLQGDLYLFYGRSLWIAAAVLGLGMTYLALSVLLFGARALARTPQIYFALAISLMAGFAFSQLSSGPTSPNGLFFLHASIILVISLIGVVVVEVFSGDLKLRRSEVVFCSLIGLASLLAIYLIPDRDSGANIAIWLRVSRSLVVLIPIFAIALAFLKKRQYFRKVSTGVLIASISISLGTFIATNSSSFGSDMSGFRRNSNEFLASSDLIEVRDWLAGNSSEDDVYASNYVCEGNDCTEPQLSQRALLSTTIERKALIESPWIASAFTEPRARDGAGDFADRLKFSATFAQNPNIEVIEFFKLTKVRWYIVDLSRTNNGLWANNPAAVIANSSFVVVDLDKFEI